MDPPESSFGEDREKRSGEDENGSGPVHGHSIRTQTSSRARIKNSIGINAGARGKLCADGGAFDFAQGGSALLDQSRFSTALQRSQTVGWSLSSPTWVE